MTRDIVVIALVKNHHSFYSQLIELLAKTGKTVTVLTILSNEHLMAQVDPNVFEVKYVEGVIPDILIRNKRLINEHDMLIVDELYDGMGKAWRLHFNNTTKICFIHNANKWFYLKNAKGLRAILKNYFKERYISQFDAYVVMGPNLKEYLGAVGVKKPIFVLPFDKGNINEETSGITNSIKITIPGMIDQSRRDYLGLLNTVSKYYEMNLKSKIKICLLGRIVGTEAQKLEHTINHINEQHGDRIVFWSAFIPDDEFERQLSSSDLLLSNLKVIKSSDDCNEVYGITKETGISYAIAKYAKPAIVPYLHQILFSLDSQLLKYRNHESLVGIFEELDSGKIDLIALKANALANREYVNGKFDEMKAQLSNYILEQL